MPTKNQVARALVVRELWERVVLDAQSPNETSWIGAAIVAGVALETALKSALSKDKTFLELINEFAQAHSDKVEARDISAAHQLRMLRNGVQHGGAIPARRAVTRAVEDVEEFLTKAVVVAFDVDLFSIRHIDLIDDPVLKPALRFAYTAAEAARLGEALAVAGACYEQMRFRLSAEGVSIRAPGRGREFTGFLPTRFGELSAQMLNADLGINPKNLVLGEIDLADNANRLFAYSALGMSAAWLARMETILELMTKHSKDFAAAMESEDLKGCDQDAVLTVLDYLTREVWRLEETERELFGLEWGA